MRGHPKAKAKGKAKARPKAAAKGGAIPPGILRRPAARVGRRMRRPAAGAAGDPEDQWLQGREMPLHEVKLEHLGGHQTLEITKGVYYGNEVAVVGGIQKIEMEGGEMHLQVKLTGTPSEAILRSHTADPTKVFKIHKCPKDCSFLETGDHYLHGVSGRLILQDSQLPVWGTNLKGVEGPAGPGPDELEGLRKRGENLPGPERRPSRDREEEDPPAKKEKKEKKKKKKKKEEKDSEKKKDKKQKSEEEEEETYTNGKNPLRAGVKSLSSLFAGTGMDPRERIRNRVLKAAKRYVEKKDKKKESEHNSGSSTSSTASEDKEAPPSGLFADTSRARSVSERFPGTLCAEAMKAMQESLLLEQGEDNLSPQVRPVAMMYFKQHLSRKASGAAARELLNLSAALDCLAKGKVALAGDILSHSIKSCEASLAGTHFSVSQRMEVPLPDQMTLAQRQEIHNAQQETYKEQRTRYLASSGAPRKDDNKYESRYGKDDRGGKNGKGKNDRDRKGQGKGRDDKGAKGSQKTEEKK